MTGDQGLRIVKTYGGERTGETNYETEDGHRWTSKLSNDLRGEATWSGRRVGWIYNGRVYWQPK